MSIQEYLISILLDVDHFQKDLIIFRRTTSVLRMRRLFIYKQMHARAQLEYSLSAFDIFFFCSGSRIFFKIEGEEKFGSVKFMYACGIFYVAKEAG